MITNAVDPCLFCEGRDPGALLVKDEPGKIDIPAFHRLDSIVDSFDFWVSLGRAIRVFCGASSYPCSEIIIRPCKLCYPSAKELANLVSHVERETDVREECDE